VVAVIAPFNMPLKLAIRSVAPALALGNAVTASM
jgi:benzaldehyde dehydrogenase (NAD)